MSDPDLPFDEGEPDDPDRASRWRDGEEQVAGDDYDPAYEFGWPAAGDEDGPCDTEESWAAYAEYWAAKGKDVRNAILRTDTRQD